MSAQSRVVADRYRLAEPLGQGGMGRVWHARDELLHRDVAIKELVPPVGLTEDERQEMRERTMREARAIARLSHPNVVRIFDILRTDADPWIVMEYVPSRSLQDVLAQDGPLPVRRVIEIGLAMVSALKAAHRAGVVHRDVKPGNVLLGDDGRVVLTDFGLATVPGDPVVTRTGLVLGSPAYISPERAHDGTAGPAADMWSLGATLYAAVEGQSPYARPSAIATLAALATEPPAPARRAGVLKSVLSGLLRKDPAERIGADEVERLLMRAAGRRPRTARTLLPKVRRPLAETYLPVPAAPRPVEPEPPAEPADPAPEALEAPVEPATPVVEEPAAVEDQAEEKPATVRGQAPPVPPPVAGTAHPPLPVLLKERPAWAVGAVAAVIALVVVLVVVLSDGDPGGERGGGVAAPAAQTPTTAPTKAPTMPPTTEPTAAPTTEPPPATGENVALPAGWHFYRHRTGFAVAVPRAWRVQEDGTIVYFREQTGERRVLGIDRSDTPKADPVRDWRQQEAQRADTKRNYERVKIEAVTYRDYRTADWEYKYDGSARLHAINRGFVTAPDQAHAILWITPDRTWQENLDEFALITRSFQPIP
jgi:hypothetical protein